MSSPAWAQKPPAHKAAAATPAVPVKLVAKQRPAKIKIKAAPAKGASVKAASKGKHGKAARAPVEAVAEPVKPQQKTLKKSAAPVRVEFGCTSENGSLAPVGQVLKAQGKAFRCQQTWDFENGKMVSYPAWIELFMPSAVLGAGLRETARPAEAPPAPELPVNPANPAATPATVPETPAAPTSGDAVTSTMF